MSIIIGIDHGYYAIKTAHCSFPAGLTSYGEHEPYGMVARKNPMVRTHTFVLSLHAKPYWVCRGQT